MYGRIGSEDNYSLCHNIGKQSSANEIISLSSDMFRLSSDRILKFYLHTGPQKTMEILPKKLWWPSVWMGLKDH